MTDRYPYPAVGSISHGTMRDTVGLALDWLERQPLPAE